MNTQTTPEGPNRLIVWGSGGGSTYRAVAEAIGQGLVTDLAIPLVITDKEGAGILGQVEEMNRTYGFDTETMVINRARFSERPNERPKRGQTDREAEETVRVMEAHPDAVLALLGCMRILHDDVVDLYGWHPEFAEIDPEDEGIHLARLLNTHPGITPETMDTHGVGTSERALELRLKQTAHSLLAVSNVIDGGPAAARHLIDIPNYDLSTPDKLAAAARHLFECLVQPTEKAHIAFDLADFARRRAEKYPISAR